MTDPRLTELNERLAALATRQRQRTALERRIAGLRQQVAEERERLAEHSATLAREQQDVARLEGRSLTALFAAALGTRDERVARERQELLAARLKHDASQETVAALERELAELAAQLAALGSVDAAYEATLREKALALAASGGPAGRQLAELRDSIAGLQADVREHDEAAHAGRQALESLRLVVDALESAEGWGTWDLIGGGLLATAAKHGRIDDARAAAHVAQTRLRRFRAELGDIRVADEPGGIAEIDALTTFGDYFFDGLLMDWVVQSQIRHSLERTREVAETVGTLVATLETRLATLQLRLRAAEERQRTLVTGA